MVPTIFTADINDREKVLSVVLMGFSTDPFLRWICPEADNYLLFKEGFDAFGGKALETNTTYVAEVIKVLRYGYLRTLKRMKKDLLKK